MTMIYLACPYWHEDPIIRNDRAELASLAAAMLMDAGFTVFSPLSHGDAVRKHLPGGNRPHEWWMKQDIDILARCDEMFVLPLEGWEFSKGVREEISFCKLTKKPITAVRYLPEGFADRLCPVSSPEHQNIFYSTWSPAHV